jgi:hypothetical protein
MMVVVLGWADSLNAGVGSEWCNGCEFSVTVELTEEGKGERNKTALSRRRRREKMESG